MDSELTHEAKPCDVVLVLEQADIVVDGTSKVVISSLFNETSSNAFAKHEPTIGYQISQDFQIEYILVCNVLLINLNGG